MFVRRLWRKGTVKEATVSSQSLCEDCLMLKGKCTENEPADQLVACWKPLLGLDGGDAGSRDDHSQHDQSDLSPQDGSGECIICGCCRTATSG